MEQIFIFILISVCVGYNQISDLKNGSKWLLSHLEWRIPFSLNKSQNCSVDHLSTPANTKKKTLSFSFLCLWAGNTFSSCHEDIFTPSFQCIHAYMTNTISPGFRRHFLWLWHKMLIFAAAFSESCNDLELLKTWQKEMKL